MPLATLLRLLLSHLQTYTFPTTICSEPELFVNIIITFPSSRVLCSESSCLFAQLPTSFGLIQDYSAFIPG